MGIDRLKAIEISAIDLQSSLMLCLAWLRTSSGPMKSRASMPGCRVNNTLMMGTESVAAMVATEWLLRCSDGSGRVIWIEEADAFDTVAEEGECAWTEAVTHDDKISLT
jgi:hypothetical protein